MSPQTIYLITGANRGIGLGLTAALLLRSETTVIATVRTSSTATEELRSLPARSGSRLLVHPLDSESDTDAATLVGSLAQDGVTHIDTVIANAGSGTSFLPSLTTPLSTLRADFEINTLGPIKLFQAIYPLLTQSPSTAKFILISSSLGSIGEMEGACPSLAYGVSKAGANYLVRKVHFECEKEGLVALSIHPGWVKTANGQNFADSLGVDMPPLSIEESVRGVLKQIDAATRSTSSGSFVSYDGSIVLW